MDDLQTILDALDDRELDYVFERSRVTSDAEAFKRAGIPKSSFYKWAETRRAELNDYALRLKRRARMRAQFVLEEAAECAARRIVGLVDHGNPHVGLRAAQDVLDRTAGKPTQRQEVSGPDGGAVTAEVKLDLSGMDAEQLRTLAQALED